jgi:hypothetical protein
MMQLLRFYPLVFTIMHLFNIVQWSSITSLLILGLIYYCCYKLVTCLSILSFIQVYLQLSFFLLIDSISGHLIYFYSLLNIIDCLNNTPHTRTINLLCLIHLDLSLNFYLANQATMIGGRILALACDRILVGCKGSLPCVGSLSFTKTRAILA